MGCPEPRARAGPLRQPPADPVARPGGRLRRDPPADRRASSSRGTTSQGTGIAFMRDYGIPSIAALLDRTREFEDHGTKRYDDTHPDRRRGHPRRHRLAALARSAAPPQPDPRPLRHPPGRARLRPRHHDRGAGPLDLRLWLAPARPARAGRDRQGHHPLRRADGHPRPAHDLRRLPRAARRLRASSTSRTPPPSTRLAEASIRIAPRGRAATAAAAGAPGERRDDGRAAARGPRDAAPARGGSSGPCTAASGCAVGSCAWRRRVVRPTCTARRPIRAASALSDLGPLTMLDELNRRAS